MSALNNPSLIASGSGGGGGYAGGFALTNGTGTLRIGGVCAWCDAVYNKEGEEMKQHLRVHVYEDLIQHKIKKQEASVTRQKELKRYLESVLH